MKQIIFLLLILRSIPGYSQATLEFNQVLWTTLSGTAGTTQTVVVPSNKVWKIESAGISISSGVSSNIYALKLDEQVIATNTFYESSSVTIASKVPVNGFPIWLPSGSYELKVANVFGGGISCNAFISVIEFNVQ